ncbi:glycosyltransferase family protein [Imhoffiella purpurea]|uniref:Uncharacterized protein n=1 Tax=Imhoffiella purpurea TaxID=1249627 RepID=W9VFN2_9GAMM|nr:hypothetical protein [Imhoffiella purpurea]EXJ14827.1 hypothetical protein D779_2033 [Imhoffiella purpurea]
MRDLLERTGRYRVTLVNPYREIHPQLDVYARWTPYDGERIYNELIIRDGRTGPFCLAYYAIIMASVVIQAPIGRRAFRAYFDRTRPDLIISVLPLLNRVITDAARDARGHPEIPVAVLMTDWLEVKRGSWYPRGRDYYALCGTAAGRASLADGRRGARLFPLTGLLIHPRFLNARLRPEDRAAERSALNLDPARPTICFLYGAGGNWRIRDLALKLREDPLPIQAIFLCGRHQALTEELAAIDWPFPVVIEGFTREVHRFLGLADLFVGKPGPGSVSEALALGLGLLLDRATALPQEQALVKWLDREGLGQSFRRPDQFVALVRKACGAENMAPFPPHPHRGPGTNRAADELPGVIDEILRLGPPP